MYCPFCKSKKIKIKSNRDEIYHCLKCKKNFSITKYSIEDALFSKWCEEHGY